MDTFNELPEGMPAEHGDLMLAVDIMYMNEIPFVMMTSWATHFITAKLIKNEKKSTIMISLKQVIEAYQARGFKICHIIGNAQKHFKKMGIILNITSHNKHVPKIERYIRTVKERL